MARFIVSATSFGDMADHHCVVETPGEALAQFHARYGDRVRGFDVRVDNIDEETSEMLRPLYERIWDGDGGGRFLPEPWPYLGPY